MEQVEYDGIEIDRCKNCRGIWFDAGESDMLRNREAAAAIDTGDPIRGKQTNEVNRYRCPRCNGGMLRKIDPQQTNIWYEECTSCRGSFFDAGEFADVSQRTISDLIDRLSCATSNSSDP
jgi:Zn-finger nucleic acid-binding protein